MIKWQEMDERLETGALEVLGKQYRIVQTCIAAPEQYDVFLGSLEVGYLRLRNGKFRADYKAGPTETVYSYNDPQGRDDFLKRHATAL